MTALSKMNDIINFRNLCNLTTKLVGLQDGDLALRSRKKKYQIPRAVASMVGIILEGTHFNIIANEINRDRTLINHYRKNHEAEYKTYPAYRELFNKVYRAYKNIQDAKPSFESNEALRQHLRKFGIYDSDLKQVKIKIISGKKYSIYNFSYEEFSGKVEICRLALNDYDMDTKLM